MKVGDSFFIPCLNPAELVYILDTRSKVAKVKIKTFITSKDGYLGVRVWRLR